MIRVIKLGGSLLTWPDLPSAIHNWLASQPPAFNVLLTGGGPFADAIRQADRNFALGDELSHWLAIDVLSITAKILAAATPELPLITDYIALKNYITTQRNSGILFDPCDFLFHHEAHLPGPILPHNWTVTSDSIAARLAQLLPANELVLLKSADPPAGSPAELATAGYVDRYFPTAAAAIHQFRFVNLRNRFPASV
jgi:5-(aminomethyl)-3-furanmethanol phosphate kinase